MMGAFLRSRRALVLWTALLLLALDAGRSLVGHFGFLTPASVWRPDQKLYADMTWPPSSNVPANATPAQRIYIEKCALCDGPDGRGNGADAPSMIPRPRDFTEGPLQVQDDARGRAVQRRRPHRRRDRRAARQRHALFPWDFERTGDPRRRRRREGILQCVRRRRAGADRAAAALSPQRGQRRRRRRSLQGQL